MKKFFPEEIYNPITISGAALSSLSFGLIVFLTILDLLSAESKPYMGILTFIIFPAFLLIGLALALFGLIRERGRLKKGIIRKRRLVIINLNDPKQRKFLISISLGIIVLLFFSAFGSYKAYEYSNQDEFCGLVCHEVMEPEYIAYLTSPHSRVGCVHCHIGSGTTWFVRSKISGAYQVYSVLFNKYSKPIPTPVKELRPAEGTCEQCHSPEHFFSEIRFQSDYYLYDEDNSKSSISMLLKIGGGNKELGRTEGIHWHMNTANKIEYIYTDSIRSIIPWVKVTRLDGSEVVYKDKTVKFNAADYPEENRRTMDCIDCHNRPSHIFHPPDKSVNLSMSLGRISETLPYIKNMAVKVLEVPYTSKPIALDSIAISIDEFYELNYPAVFKNRKSDIKNAVEEIKKIYKRNYFPDMKVSWRAFPNHISHLYDSGCFRCHDGKHVSENGEVIKRDCNLCHTIISQTTVDGKEFTSMKGIQFVHPKELGTDLNDLSCVNCHARK